MNSQKLDLEFMWKAMSLQQQCRGGGLLGVVVVVVVVWSSATSQTTPCSVHDGAIESECFVLFLCPVFLSFVFLFFGWICCIACAHSVPIITL